MKNTEVWNISEKDFPENGDLKDILRFISRYAILAPSGHNTQPWKIRINDDSLELIADFTRSLPVIDPLNRQLITSVGASAGNIFTALNYFGFNYNFEYINKSNDNFAVLIIPIKGRIKNQKDKNLFLALTKRRTNRNPFEEKLIDGLIIQSFQTIVSEEKIKLSVMEGEYREKLISIIEEGDKLQSSNQKFCKELSEWVHPERSDSKDGIPGYAFGQNDVITTSGPFYIGNLDWGKIQAGRDRNLIKGSPLIVILESRNNEPEDWFKTGIALERLLLCAASENISASYLNQPLEIPELNQRVKSELNIKGFPQQILRMGYGKPVKPTPRRNLEEILLK